MVTAFERDGIHIWSNDEANSAHTAPYKQTNTHAHTRNKNAPEHTTKRNKCKPDEKMKNEWTENESQMQLKPCKLTLRSVVMPSS